MATKNNTFESCYVIFLGYLVMQRICEKKFDADMFIVKCTWLDINFWHHLALKNECQILFL